ncbi:hypothetical protein CYMTET_5754 [Cymbomonas tetramitiformis]|uniref:pyruvate kinase n=1 Tax=Cymbomonas tetramitiformis TaxID=36881 RepID=A0AAE0LIR8_9CHLO|nr:hypothetical protein CYMTET_5754 [Cymbomonas tetramitiformis]
MYPDNIASILKESEGSNPTGIKIVGTVGLQAQSVEVLKSMLEAGMTVARFDFSWGDREYHQKTYDNLQLAVKESKIMTGRDPVTKGAVALLVMLDTKGLEITVMKDKSATIEISEGQSITLTTDVHAVATSTLLPVSCPDLPHLLKPGDPVFIARYLFTGSETSSTYLEVHPTPLMSICRHM